MDFLCLYTINNNFKTQDLLKVKDINLEIYEYLSQLNNELIEIHNTKYIVSKLVAYHYNKLKSYHNYKEVIQNNFFTSRGLNSKIFQHNGIYIKINFPYLYDKLLEIGKSLENGIYDLYYDIDIAPICINCGKNVSFINFKNGYRKFCSLQCSALISANKEETKEKRKITNKEKYGAEFPTQSPEIKDKISISCLEKHGVLWTSQIPGTLEKQKQTKLEKYGDENFVNVEKAKETCLKRYGVDNPFKINWIHDKGINAAASEESKDKIKQTK